MTRVYVTLGQTKLVEQPEPFGSAQDEQRGAPFLAPMPFANMGLLGLTVLLDPKGIE